MSTQGKMIKGLLKAKRESVMGKLANEFDPMEPWSAKSDAPIKNSKGLSEEESLDESNNKILFNYVKSLGYDPKFMPFAKLSTYSRSDSFKRFKNAHVFDKNKQDIKTEEVVAEEVLDVSSTYKKLAVKHLRDSTAKSSTNAQKNYAKKMIQRALQASKMDNHTDALNHYRGVSEGVDICSNCQVDPCICDDTHGFVKEARMSVALRMQRAIERQRAKSDASRARTPSSIPKKEEPKKQGVAEGSKEGAYPKYSQGHNDAMNNKPSTHKTLTGNDRHNYVSGYKDGLIDRKKHHGVAEETIHEADKSSGHIATSQSSSFGGYRPRVVDKKTGKSIHTSVHVYKSETHAKNHAKAYLKAHNENGADAGYRAGQNYAKANIQHLHNIKEQGVAEDVMTEMDSQGYDGSRDQKRRSTYGSRDDYSDSDPQHTAKPTTAAKTTKQATNILNKAFKNVNKKKGVAEGKEYTPPKLGTVKANLMNTQKPTVQVQVFKHNTLRGDSYWVNKEVKVHKTMDQAQAHVDRINKQSVAEETIHEAGTGHLMSFIKAKGLSPLTMDGNQKKAYSRSSEYKIFKARHQAKMVKETSGMGERGDDWDDGILPAGRAAPLAKKKTVKEEADTKDTVCLDIPLLIRVLEFTREDMKTDVQLHNMVERLIDMRHEVPLTMENYAAITGKLKEEVEQIDELKKTPDNMDSDDIGVAREDADPCWKGYKMVGMKKKGSRPVPNCVPKSVSEGIYGIEDSPTAATHSVKAMESKKISNAAKMVKAIQKKRVNETTYDWEKSEKGGDTDPEVKTTAKITLKGGKTMTGKPRDTVEIEPVLRTKINSPNGMKPNV